MLKDLDDFEAIQFCKYENGSEGMMRSRLLND